MKKTMKKLLPLLLAVVMSLAFAGAALAEDGTITIKPPSESQTTDSHTYKIYKVFDAVGNGTNISYKLVSGKTTVPAGFAVDSAGNVTYNGSGQNGELTAADIAAIAGYVTESDLVDTATSTGTVAAVSKSLPNGYYFITTTTGTVVTINSTNPNVEVDDKNTVPTLDKDIQNVNNQEDTGADNESDESATAKIGDTINYGVTITANKGAENFVYHDKMSSGLTLNTTSKPVVKVGGTALTEDEDYVLTKFANDTNDANDDITITFNKSYLDTIATATTITIEYSATLNENAVIDGEGNPNTATLEYGHNPTDDTKPGSETPPDTPKVYTYEFQLVKANSSNTILQGAEFKLYQEEACTNEIALVKVENGKYRVATAAEQAASGFTPATIEAGTPEIIGLGNGTYYLKETKAPDGYNLLKDPAEVTITDANNDATFKTTTTENDTYVSGGVEVINQQGTALPSTGGIGTTIFYIAGSALVLVAGAALFARRVARKQS